MNALEVLNDWYTRIDLAQKAHNLSADRYYTRLRMLGIPTVVLSLFVGTSVFAALRSKPSPYWQIFVGFCSVLAAVLAGLQTFFGDAERSERHRMAGAKYGALGRELEILITSASPVEQKTIDRIREKIDSLAMESPINGKAIYERAAATKGPDASVKRV